MSERPRHSKKEIEEALQYAEDNGWTVQYPFGHWGAVRCPQTCFQAVFSTPANVGNHAKAIRRAVDRCDHPAKPDDAEEVID
jgi:hypothetical protein